MILNIVIITISLGIVVFVHELGHFLLAKFQGVNVEKFSIGFGKEIYGFNFKSTRYIISMIPIGGYVKMAGENYFENNEAVEGDFLWLKWWKRILVVFFGPLMSCVFAAFLFFILVYRMGVIVPTNQPIIGEVVDSMPAKISGIQEGDKILLVNNKSVNSWKEIVDLIHPNGEKINIRIERDKKEIDFEILPVYDKEAKMYLIGIAPKIETGKLSLIKSFIYSLKYTFFISILFFKSIFLIIIGEVKPDVMGTVGIVHSLGVAVNSGWPDFINLLALISLNLGLMNLLPIPMLDGGHIFIFTIEGIRKKRLSMKTMQIIQTAGFILLISLVIFATQKDLVRIFLKK